jgi:hypothetical protein
MRKFHHKFKRYSADTDGNIYGIRKPMVSVMTNKTTGYAVVTLREGNEQKQYRAHRFIYECFLGRPIRDGFVINHIDGNKLNNAISNLEEITYKENTLHAFATGLCAPKKGELNGCATITAETVRNIIRDIMHNSVVSNIELGEKYYMEPKHVSLIRYKTRWKFIFDEDEFKGYIPPKSPLTSGNNLNNILKILHFALTTTISNKRIGELFNVHPSGISRVRTRSKPAWVDALNIYKQQSSETIENLMTPSELVEYRQAMGSGTTP